MKLGQECTLSRTEGRVLNESGMRVKGYKEGAARGKNHAAH